MHIGGLNYPDLRDAVWAALRGRDYLALFLVWGTVALAAAVTYWQARAPDGSRRSFWHHCLPPGTLRHPSARADFLFWLSRRLFMPLLVLPLGLSTVTAGYGAYWLLTFVFGPASHAGPAGTPLLCAFTLSMVIAYDLSYYIYHYLCHRVPLLWELHKVHHSAEVMVGVTKDRVHPLDEILNRWWNGLIPGLAYGIWLFFALDPVELTVFGIGAYTLRALLMMDVVRHTHLEMSYGKWLNALFLCPYYHQLHHSIEPRHYNRNYGLLLSVWDRMFGTLAVPEPGQHFTFGLADNEHAEYQSLVRLHVVPLQKMWALTRTWLARHVATQGHGTRDAEALLPKRP
ncbi:MAG: sterol desaturase family protein [Acetobacteraceae bacterium]|nr:sterol desaturase family protein [Acetobacteraceae bacterium]